MYFDKQKYFTRFILVFGLIFAPSLFAQGYTLAPVPGWVESVRVPASDQAEQLDNSNGVAYLLVDHQWRVNDKQQSQYRHYFYTALNTSGVAEVSQISIDFDPVYESVVLHQIIVHRDGRILDRINRSQINLIQREKELEYQIYDGSKTLNIFIEDVRSGDNIEYSYSIEGVNPVFSGHFSRNLKMRWEVPVGHLHYRILWPSSRPLHIRNHNTTIKPEKRTSGEYTEYVWSENNINELISDVDTPDWYNPFPVVYLSDIDNWGEVADWAWPLYKPVINTTAQKTITTPILASANTPEQQVLAALHFVQDEVRYLGIEIGVRSHKPNAPDTVIKQRFGDCKDKSRLLVSLLQGMGIEAHSALVNTYSEMQVNKPLPTPTVFNHAVVRTHINGKSYWLDPTLTYQSGNLDTLYQPDYDYALVISDRGSDLVKMSDDITAVHSKAVEETIDIRDAINNPATYKILTHNERYYADSMREDLSETSSSQVQQNFLNYMVHYFPAIQVADKIRIDDDGKLNRLTLTEQYTIPDIWTKSDDERYVYVDFEPYLINDHVTIVEAPIRTMPYAVTHPVRYQHTTRILVPEDSSFDKEFTEIEDKAFRFTRKVDFSNDILVIEYAYESLSDHVKPEDLQTYSNNIAALQNITSFQVYMPNPAINFGEYHFDAADLNWLLIIIVLLAAAGITFASYKYIYLYDPPYQAPDQINTRLVGLKGWLILPGLAVILTPIRIIIQSGELWYVFSALQWSIVGDQFGTGMLVISAFELVCNVAMVVIGLFLIILFFTRRHTFPRFFIAFLLFSLVVFGTDLLVLYLLSYPGVEVTPLEIGELIRLALYTTLWSLYFIKSERVKATFTRQRKPPGVLP